MLEGTSTRVGWGLDQTRSRPVVGQLRLPLKCGMRMAHGPEESKSAKVDTWLRQQNRNGIPILMYLEVMRADRLESNERPNPTSNLHCPHYNSEVSLPGALPPTCHAKGTLTLTPASHGPPTPVHCTTSTPRARPRLSKKSIGSPTALLNHTQLHLHTSHFPLAIPFFFAAPVEQKSPPRKPNAADSSGFSLLIMAEPPSQKAAGGGKAGKPRPTEATAAVVREKGATEDVTMNGPLYKRKSANVVLVRRQRRKDEGAFRLLASLFVENQIGESPLPLFRYRQVCCVEESAAPIASAAASRRAESKPASPSPGSDSHRRMP